MPYDPYIVYPTDPSELTQIVHKKNTESSPVGASAPQSMPLACEVPEWGDHIGHGWIPHWMPGSSDSGQFSTWKNRHQLDEKLGHLALLDISKKSSRSWSCKHLQLNTSNSLLHLLLKGLNSVQHPLSLYSQRLVQHFPLFQHFPFACSSAVSFPHFSHHCGFSKMWANKTFIWVCLKIG